MKTFENDILELFEDKIKKDDEFCKKLYSSITNITWKNKDGDIFDCGFRYAGGLISDIRDNKNESYMTWCLDGIYGVVDTEIEEELLKRGWTYVKN